MTEMSLVFKTELRTTEIIRSVLEYITQHKVDPRIVMS